MDWKDLQAQNPPPDIWPLGDLANCDPYLIWQSLLPDQKQNADKQYSVLVELNNIDDYYKFIIDINPTPLDNREPYFRPSELRQENTTKFVVGFTNQAGIKALHEATKNKRIQRFSVQDPRHAPLNFNQTYFLKLLNRYKNALILESWKTFPEGLKDNAYKQAGGVDFSGPSFLGIIDDGLPLARSWNLDQCHMWDQGWRKPHQPPQNEQPPNGINSSSGPVAKAPPMDFGFGASGFTYGEEFHKTPLASDPTSRVNGSPEATIYREANYFDPPPRHTHGAAVLGLMAPWLGGCTQPVDMPKHISGLAMVQLPTTTVEDTSGGSLAARALDGLRYILQKEHASRMPPQGAPRPVVANISYGIHAGPHDGTSMFERALLELLDKNKHLHVVLPAGNSARAGCHAQRHLAKKDDPEAKSDMLLRVLPDNRQPTFVEIWLPDKAAVKVGIHPPGYDKPLPLTIGESKVLVSAASGSSPEALHAFAIYPASVAQSTRGTMILLAICPTQRRRSASSVQLRGISGLWKLQVTNLGDAPICVDAWIERDDAPPDYAVGSRQAYFPDTCATPVTLRNATPTGTLNGIATLTHDRLKVVGAMTVDGLLSSYTAAGESKGGRCTRAAPDAVMPADWSLAQPGLRTLGFAPGTTSRINGTSAACALYARLWAEQLGGASQLPDLAKFFGPPYSPNAKTCAPEHPPEAPADHRGAKVRVDGPWHTLDRWPT